MFLNPCFLCVSFISNLNIISKRVFLSCLNNISRLTRPVNMHRSGIVMDIKFPVVVTCVAIRCVSWNDVKIRFVSIRFDFKIWNIELWIVYILLDSLTFLRRKQLLHLDIEFSSSLLIKHHFTLCKEIMFSEIYQNHAKL